MREQDEKIKINRRNKERKRRMEKLRRRGTHKNIGGKGGQRGKKDGKRKGGEEKEGRGR